MTILMVDSMEQLKFQPVAGVSTLSAPHFVNSPLWTVFVFFFGLFSV